MNQEQLSEQISRVRGGDIDAFGPLVLEYQGAVRSFLAVRLDDAHEAEDLAQEVFLVAFRQLHEFDTSRPMNHWLRGIAANLLNNHLRRRRETTLGPGLELDVLFEQAVGDVETESSGSRLLPALRECLAKLDGRARQLIEWRYMRGHALEDICRLMNLKHSALTMALHRLRERLHDCVARRLAEVKGTAQ